MTDRDQPPFLNPQTPPGHHREKRDEGRESTRDLRAKHSTTQRVILGAAALGLAGLIGLHAGRSGQNVQPAPTPAQTQATAPPARTIAALSLTSAMIAPEDAEAALKQSGLSGADQAHVLAAVRNGEMELASVFLFDASGATGHRVTVTSDGIAQSVTLTPQPQKVVIAIPPTMQITIGAEGMPGPGGTAVGDVTPQGTLAALPPFLQPGDNAIVQLVLQ